MKKTVLVIDDQPYNAASAQLVLEGYDYLVVDTLSEAYELLESGRKFDFVLTDLWMPRGDFTGPMRYGDNAETMVPAGLVFALRAANDGSQVVICSDSDHHKDRLCSLLNLIRGGGTRNTLQISFVEARTCPIKGKWENGQIVLTDEWPPGPHPKDWLRAMKCARLVPFD